LAALPVNSGSFLVPPTDGDGAFETKAPSRPLHGQTFQEYEQRKRMEALEAAALEERKAKVAEERAKEIKKPVKTHCMCGQKLAEYEQQQKSAVQERRPKPAKAG